MSSKNNFQKELRSDITRKLDNALSDLKSMLGEKEFADRVKKAAKLFTGGIKGNEAVKEPATVKAKAIRKSDETRREEIVAADSESNDVKTPSKKAAAKQKSKKK